jgi:hypothetical protein
MRTTRAVVTLVAMAVVMGLACGPVGGVGNENYNEYRPPDGAVNTECEPFADDDGDTLTNHDEGCEFNRDSDGDGIFDYVDQDSDNDGISDFIEAGDQNPQTPPRDTDGDGIPDYLDQDSDNDGVPDREEDRNGDGVVGNCTEPCPCAVPGDYCSPTAEVCINMDCLDGETDPGSADTDGDGLPDGQEPTFICNARSESNPNGRKPVQRQTHSSGLFQVALEEMAIWLETNPDNAGYNEAAASFDLTDADHETAGFVLARPASAADAATEAQTVIQQLNTMAGATSTPLTSGSATTSHDGHDTVVSAVVRTTISGSMSIGAARNQIIAAILGRSVADFPVLSQQNNGVVDTEFIVSFAVQVRADGQGLVIGAVATTSGYNSSEHVGYLVDDMANATSLAESAATTEIECESYIVESSPVADIIWVVDDSGSMDDDQQRVADAGTTFLNIANQSGLDWRMCVVDMTLANPGDCCTRAGQSDDFWLGPTQSGDFLDCITDPAGHRTASGGAEHGISQMEDAINQHLPRNATDTHKIRPEAKLVVIFVSDEPAQEFTEGCSVGWDGSGWDASCDAMVTSYSSYLSQPEIDAIPHGILVPGSTPDCSDLGAWSRGYEEVINQVGGQIGSICQTDLTATLALIIQDIVGSASPVVLHHTPISVSLAVAKEDKGSTPSTFLALPRSRVNGFDYRASSNSIVFLQQDFSDPPYEVVVSYQRWVTGIAPPD